MADQKKLFLRDYIKQRLEHVKVLIGGSNGSQKEAYVESERTLKEIQKMNDHEQELVTAQDKAQEEQRKKTNKEHLIYGIIIGLILEGLAQYVILSSFVEK